MTPVQPNITLHTQTKFPSHRVQLKLISTEASLVVVAAKTSSTLPRIPGVFSLFFPSPWDNPFRGGRSHRAPG